MSEQITKRRKLEISSGINKPFKSPFHNIHKKSSVSSAGLSPPPILSTPASHRVSVPLHQRFPLYPATTSPQDDALNVLRSRHASLLNQTRNLCSKLDNIKQALAIEESNKDGDLERLIMVWRRVSQQAAEELFATFHDKVNKMGGLVAWKRKERDQRDRLEHWNNEEDDLSDSTGDEDDDDKSCERAKKELHIYEAREAARQARREAKAAAKEMWETAEAGMKEESQTQENELEDRGFAMDTMLKDLKVDLAVIGYDTGEQKWIS